MSNWFDILYGGTPAGGTPATPQGAEGGGAVPAHAPETPRVAEPARVTEPLRIPDPVKAPEPPRVQEPVRISEPVRAPEPPRMQEPMRIPEPMRAPEPPRMQEPMRTPEPMRAPEPPRMQEPMRTPEPMRAPEPPRMQEPMRTPEPMRAPEPPRVQEPLRAPEVQRPAYMAVPPDRPGVSSMQQPRSTMRLTREQLRSAPPLPRMPSRWSLELQKAAFHLSHTDFGEGCRVVCFSGLQRGGGTSTISYLVAHYLAAETAGQRVLFLDFSTDGRSAAVQGADGVLRVGEAVPTDFLRVNPNAFARYSVRPGGQDTPINSSRWFRELMDIAREHCDWVIVDAPPFFSSPESYPVAQACDGTVLVIKSGETRYPAINGLVADLEQMGIRTLGTIMNFRRYPVPRWLLKYI